MVQLNNKKSLKEVRRALRNDPTQEEYDLWLRLKNKQLMGSKFRRQHSFGDFVMDFYCPEEKLAVELDGSHHFTEQGNQSDGERDAILNSFGIRVVRFENREVRENMDRVLNMIGKFLRKDEQPLPSPLLRNRGG